MHLQERTGMVGDLGDGRLEDLELKLNVKADDTLASGELLEDLHFWLPVHAV